MLLIILILLTIFLISYIKIVPQSDVYIIERFGKFYKTVNAKTLILIPFIDSIKKIVTLKQQIYTIPKQSIITANNITITSEITVSYHIIDPVKAVYEVLSLEKGIEYIAIVALRDIIKNIYSDDIASSKQYINTQLYKTVSEAASVWGAQIDNINIINIEYPSNNLY